MRRFAWLALHVWLIKVLLGWAMLSGLSTAASKVWPACHEAAGQQHASHLHVPDSEAREADATRTSGQATSLLADDCCHGCLVMALPQATDAAPACRHPIPTPPLAPWASLSIGPDLRPPIV